MKTLRGRPPRNISDSGIIYLDSDGEESDYSDSDVEPVYFPAAEFEFDVDGEAIVAGFVEEFNIGLQQDDSDDDDDDDDDDYVDLVNPDEDNDNSGDTVELVAEDSLINNSGEGGDQEDQVVFQYFGGTVQVRHIVNENFRQLQQQQQQRGLTDDASEAPAAAGTSSSISQSEGSGAGTATFDVVDHAAVSGDSPGEPPSIHESEITIGSVNESTSKMTDPISNEDNPVKDDHEIGERATSSSEPNILVRDADSTSEAKSKEDEPQADDVGPSTSGLVPYPDLPDYASGDEDDDEIEGERESRRQSLKRKERDRDGSSSEDEDRLKSARTSKPRDEEPSDNEEETCNPMVSDTEEFEEAEELRGDRIGCTVYSECHVLKILMKWIEKLPEYSIDRLMNARENEEAEEVIEKTILRLETEFEEQMALLWDMSAEVDVMKFLVENKIFSFIRDTVDRSACGRLTEIALGVLANVLSEPSIIDDFTVHDGSLDLVAKVVELTSKVSDVSVLIQVYSVLRRIVWYIRNVAHVKRWNDLLTSASFLESSNFIMRSSTNVLLLGFVIVLFFGLIDCLNTENDHDDDECVKSTPEVEQSGSEPETKTDPALMTATSSQKHLEKAERAKILAKEYEPFCEAEFVPSLCEGLKELMKNPKPKTTKNYTSTREKPAGPSSSACNTDDRCPNADEIDVPIPEGHVQDAILKGFSTLALLQKAPNGKNALKTHASQVIAVLLDFYRVFVVCTDTDAVTRSDALEYFTLFLHLLSFCHISLEAVNVEAIIHPVTTASKLVNLEEKDKETDADIRVQLKDGVEFDSVSYIALVTHEYLASVAEKFGPDAALKVRSNSAYAKFFKVLDQVVQKFTEENSTVSDST